MAHPTDDILSAMRSPSAEDRATIQRAYDFALKAHGEEKRKSGEPYIVHPHAIALSLAQLGMDRTTIIAGILHDTTEDTDTTVEEVEKEFGNEIAFLVDGLTKYSKLKYRGMERHVESLRRLFVATASDIRIIIIKLADRLHNMQTIKYVEPLEKRERIARDTMEVYVHIAERLGIGNIKTQLEDLAFQVLEPEAFEKSEHFLKQKQSELESSLDEDVKDLKKFLAESGLRKFRIEYRFKSAYSFHTKLARKGGEVERVYDLVALRLIVPSVDICYRALGVIHSFWRPIPGRVKDYIAFPKPNGYRSLHTTVITRRGVTMEVQLRTEDMHQESQFGVASHFYYKGGIMARQGADWLKSLLPSLKKTNADSANQESPRWLKDLTSAQEEHPDYEAFEEMLRQDFFAERMFVFTPKGDVIDLPVGATPVDFAYAIHSDIGDAMNGAKADGKMISLDTPLSNGAVVEIMTKKGGTPNKKWLDFAKTAGAKGHIRSALKKD